MTVKIEVFKAGYTLNIVKTNKVQKKMAILRKHAVQIEDKVFDSKTSAAKFLKKTVSYLNCRLKMGTLPDGRKVTRIPTKKEDVV